jgi:hypothetical protein
MLATFPAKLRRLNNRTDLNAAQQARSNAVPNFLIALIFVKMLLLGWGDPAGSGVLMTPYFQTVYFQTVK